MANIPKYSPKQRAALEKQIADYEKLVADLNTKLSQKTPASPIVLPGGGMTRDVEVITTPPSPTSPGGTTNRTKTTTNRPSTVYADTADAEKVRAQIDEMNAFITQGRMDLADESKLAARFPLGVDEALDIASGQLASTPSAQKLTSFGDILGVRTQTGPATPNQMAHELLLRGAVPNDGYTFLRSIMKGARNNPRLIAEIIGGLSTKPEYATLQSDFVDATSDLTEGGIKSNMSKNVHSVSDVGPQMDTRAADLEAKAKDIPGHRRSLATAEEEAQRIIGRNRRNATIGGALAATTGVGVTAYNLLTDSDADKWNADSRKFFLGGGGGDTYKLTSSDQNEYEGALEAAIGSFASTQFGDDTNEARKKYDELIQKHRQTINRIGAGTLGESDRESAPFKSLLSDLSSFYGSSYKESAPIIFPYEAGGKFGAVSMDKMGTKFSRLEKDQFKLIK